MVVCLFVRLFVVQPVAQDKADFHPAAFTYVLLGVSCVLLLLANLALWIIRFSYTHTH